MIAESILMRRSFRSDLFWNRTIFGVDLLSRIATWMDTKVLLKSQYWPRERLESLQRARLEHTLARARAIPFWHDRLHSAKGVDFHKAFFSLPPTTRLELARAGESETVLKLPHLQLFRDRTSGTTSTPYPFVVSNAYCTRSYAICRRMFATAGARLSVIAVRARQRADFTRGGHIHFYLRGYNSIRHRIDAFIELAESLKSGLVLYGFSSTLLALSRALEAHPRGKNLPIRAVIGGGERMPPEARAEIERRFGVPVRMTYSLRELGWIAFECEEGALHVNEESYLVEVVDDEGKPLPSGKEGKILITSFEHDASAYIRYDTGDVGVLSDAPCSCGRTLRTLRVIGRSSEIVEIGGGKFVPLIELLGLFDKYYEALSRYQIIQRAEDDLLVRAVPGERYAEQIVAIRDDAVRALGRKTKVTFEAVEEIEETEAGKLPLFVRL